MTHELSNGPVLDVFAHPDDRDFNATGFIAAARLAGCETVSVTATSGEAGSQDPLIWPDHAIGSLRATEQQAADRIVGIREHHFLGYRDGGCHHPALFEAAVKRILAILRDIRPTTIITFGPDGLTGHADHRAVSAWTTEAFRRYGNRDVQLLYVAATAHWVRTTRPLLAQANAMYGAEYPFVIGPRQLSHHAVLNPALFELKLAAARAHHTQITPLARRVGGLHRLTPWFRHEAFQLAPSFVGSTR